MGTEYYIVKPNKKQIFYLGRRLGDLEGLANSCYKTEPEWAVWEDVEEVELDIIQNCKYFLQDNYTFEDITNFAAAIYEFCDDKVILDNDCTENMYWKDYEEINVLSDILTTHEKWCSLIDLIPREDWVIEDNIIYEFKTVEKYLQKLAKGEK